MGLRILNGDGQGDSRGAVMYDSVSGWAFGPVFDSYEDAEAFVQWLLQEYDSDARNLSDRKLQEVHREFVSSRAAG